MENMNTDLLWTMILLPVFAGIFKSEIANTWAAWCVYKDRPFDLDRDPNTPEICMMCNGATGEWGLVIIHRYVFWRLQSARRGVWFSHVTRDGLLSRHVGLIEWGKLPKGAVTQAVDSHTMGILQRHGLAHLAPKKKKIAEGEENETEE